MVGFDRHAREPSSHLFGVCILLTKQDGQSSALSTRKHFRIGDKNDNASSTEAE
jgi:hypothetical protein